MMDHFHMWKRDLGTGRAVDKDEKIAQVLSVTEDQMFEFDRKSAEAYLMDANKLGLIATKSTKGLPELDHDSVRMLACKIWKEANKIKTKKNMAEFVIDKLTDAERGVAVES